MSTLWSPSSRPNRMYKNKMVNSRSPDDLEHVIGVKAGPRKPAKKRKLQLQGQEHSQRQGIVGGSDAVQITMPADGSSSKSPHSLRRSLLASLSKGAETPGSSGFDAYFGQNLKVIQHEEGAMPGLERALERMAGSDKSVSTYQASIHFSPTHRHTPQALQEAAGGRPGDQPNQRLRRDSTHNSHCSNDTLLKQLKIHNQITIQVQDEAQAVVAHGPSKKLSQDSILQCRLAELPPTVDQSVSHVVLQQNVFDFCGKIQSSAGSQQNISMFQYQTSTRGGRSDKTSKKRAFQDQEKRQMLTNLYTNATRRQQLLSPLANIRVEQPAPTAKHRLQCQIAPHYPRPNEQAEELAKQSASLELLLALRDEDSTEERVCEYDEQILAADQTVASSNQDDKAVAAKPGNEVKQHIETEERAPSDGTLLPASALQTVQLRGEGQDKATAEQLQSASYLPATQQLSQSYHHQESQSPAGRDSNIVESFLQPSKRPKLSPRNQQLNMIPDATTAWRYELAQARQQKHKPPKLADYIKFKQDTCVELQAEDADQGKPLHSERLADHRGLPATQKVIAQKQMKFEEPLSKAKESMNSARRRHPIVSKVRQGSCTTHIPGIDLSEFQGLERKMLTSKNASKMSSGSIEMSVMEQASGLCAEVPLPSPPASTRKSPPPCIYIMKQPAQRELERTEHLIDKFRIAIAEQSKALRNPLTGSAMNGMGYQRSFQNMVTPQKKPNHVNLAVKATKSKKVQQTNTLHLITSQSIIQLQNDAAAQLTTPRKGSRSHLSPATVERRDSGMQATHGPLQGYAPTPIVNIDLILNEKKQSSGSQSNQYEIQRSPINNQIRIVSVNNTVRGSPQGDSEATFYKNETEPSVKGGLSASKDGYKNLSQISESPIRDLASGLDVETQMAALRGSAVDGQSHGSGQESQHLPPRNATSLRAPIKPLEMPEFVINQCGQQRDKETSRTSGSQEGMTSLEDSTKAPRTKWQRPKNNESLQEVLSPISSQGLQSDSMKGSPSNDRRDSQHSQRRISSPSPEDMEAEARKSSFLSKPKFFPQIKQKSNIVTKKPRAPAGETRGLQVPQVSQLPDGLKSPYRYRSTMRSHGAQEQVPAVPKYRETSVGCSLSLLEKQMSGISPLPNGGGALTKHTEGEQSSEMLMESWRPKGLVKQPDHAQSQHIKLPKIQHKLNNYSQFQSQEGIFTSSKRSLLQKYRSTKHDLREMERRREGGLVHSRNASASLGQAVSLRGLEDCVRLNEYSEDTDSVEADASNASARRAAKVPESITSPFGAQRTEPMAYHFMSGTPFLIQKQPKYRNSQYDRFKLYKSNLSQQQTEASGKERHHQQSKKRRQATMAKLDLIRADFARRGQPQRHRSEAARPAQSKTSEHVNVKEYNPKNTQIQSLINEQLDVDPAQLHHDLLQNQYQANLAQLKGLQKLKQKNMAKLLGAPEGSWAEGKTLTRNDQSHQYVSWKPNGSKQPEELHYFTPPDQERAIEVQLLNTMAPLKDTPAAGTQIQSVAITRTDMGYGRDRSSQNAVPLDPAMRRGQLAIEFQRLTLSSRDGEKLEEHTSKATGLGPNSPVKIGLTNTQTGKPQCGYLLIQQKTRSDAEFKATQDHADDYGLRHANAQAGSPGAVLSAASRGRAEKAYKSSVVLSREPSDRGTSDHHGSEQDLLETGYLAPAPKGS